MKYKKPLDSKTLWFNILTIIAIVMAELQASEELKRHLGDNAYWLVITAAIINMIIRFYTSKPIRKSDEIKKQVDTFIQKEETKNV